MDLRLTQGGSVGPVWRQPEHDQSEAGEEDARQREDVGREDDLPAELDVVGQHDVTGHGIGARQNLRRRTTSARFSRSVRSFSDVSQLPHQ